MRVLVSMLLLVLVAVVIYWVWLRASRMLAERSSSQTPVRRSVTPTQTRWEPAHRQVDARTEVLLRRVTTSPDGGVEVLEERAFDQWPDEDPMWEARFAESMANARHRCDVMNVEDSS